MFGGMQAVILAGGLGTRLSEETTVRPKPLVEIGGRPILWHIMKIYAAHGIKDFIICLGYKGYLIKEFFASYALHLSDVTFDLGARSVTTHRHEAEDWRVTLIDTGDATMTGGRLARVQKYISGDLFCMTYGDGVSDVNIAASVEFHRKHGKKATITAVYPPRRFGVLEMDGERVTGFREKPKGEGGFINGGFFVLSRDIANYIKNDETVWEEEPLQTLAEEGQLQAFRHEGFFQPMDTLRDRNHLERLWSSSAAPWKCW
jgi:glucose-1-phosphate cytidylyltransferase